MAGMPKMGEIRGKIVLVVLQDSHGARTERYGLNQLAGWKDGNSQSVQDNYDVPILGRLRQNATRYVVTLCLLRPR